VLLKLSIWVPHDLRGVVKAMIRDLADLEPLLRQYHPEKVLVGPLLNLWTNSSFRVFNIAGNGGKIYETIGLGFIKVETDAQRRRADIIALLESRFGEVQIFDSQLGMARVAHTLWANDETSRFLATATAESKLRLTRKVDQDQSLDDASKSGVLPNDRDKEFVDEAAHGSVAPDAASAHAPLSARDQAQPTPACDPAQAHESSSDTIANTDANTETAAETVANTETIAETDANTFRARSAKPKRRLRRPRRGAAAGVDGAAPAVADANTEMIVETDSNTETAVDTDASIQPVFEHSDQMPVEKQSQSEPASSGVRACDDDRALRQRALRPDLIFGPRGGLNFRPILQRIGIVCGIVATIACVIVLVVAEQQTIDERVPVKTPPPSVASRAGTLPSVESPVTLPAMVDYTSANAGKSMLQAQTPPADVPKADQPPPQVIATAPANPSPSNVAAPPVPAVNLPQTPPADVPKADQPPPQVIGTAPANPSPSNVAAPPVPAVNVPQTPPTTDTLSMTHAAPTQAPSPAPGKPTVVLDNNEITRLIKRGQGLLNAGDFAAARLLFKRAADGGSAEAALALGSTYDPSVIKQLGAVSVTPDIDSALKWYQVAADRGSAGAADQYTNLLRAR
jgi:hypothetical protein